MVLTGTFKGIANSYFKDLERRLKDSDPHLELYAEFRLKQSVMEVTAVHKQLEKELPELVEGFVARFTMWEYHPTNAIGLQERYELGTKKVDHSYVRAQNLNRPRWHLLEVKYLAKMMGKHFSKTILPEYIGSPSFDFTTPAIIHFTTDMFLSPTLLSPKRVYIGTTIFLENPPYETFGESPIESHLRQYLDFLHTMSPNSTLELRKAKRGTR